MKLVDTALAREVKHAHWVFYKNDPCYTDGGLYCSNCEHAGKRNYNGEWIRTRYCHNCGALMDDESAEEVEL